jgi:uncharacterized repeat protein (TIGR01451 family)
VGVTVTATSTGAGSITGGTCTTTVTDANGQCTVIVNSASTGATTIHATTTFTVAGLTLTRATGDGLSGDSSNAVKTWVDAKIAINPLSATNETGSAHTFTVTVSKDLGDGSGFVAASGATVTATLTDSNGATHSAAGGTCVTGTTDANGQCTIIVNSSTPGKVTVNATVTLSLGTPAISVTRSTSDGKPGDSANAVKTFVDSYITISPATAINNVTVTHTFTIQVFTNDGSGAGYVATSGAPVSLTLLPGSVGHVTGSSTCTTGAAGTCTITTVSSTAGDDVAQASTTVTVGGVTMTRTTGVTAPGHANSSNGAKHWQQPSIGITKNPKSQSVSNGGTASFTIVVTNTGPDTLLNVRVSDPLSPDCSKTSADIGALASMAPGASVTYSCSLAGVTAAFTNVATATGTPKAGGPDVSATDTAPVTITPPGGGGSPSNPAITITKNPKSQTISSGATANFTIVVTNTGNTTLTNVTVTDPLSTDCSKTSAQIGALGSMSAGASVTYNCSQPNVTASFTNVATVVGTTPTGGTVTATDSAPVTVTTPITPPAVVVSHPAISIVKDPKSQQIATDGTATFHITVTNTGDVTLTDVTVSDPRSTNCNRNLGTLAVGQAKTYTCTKPNVKAAFQNVATATGKPPTGSAVQATDNANITVRAPLAPAPIQDPKIKIVKSPKSQTLTTKIKTTKTTNGANKTTVTYGTAIFKIKVTNTGNVALHSVKVGDPLSPGCSKTIGALAKGKSTSYTCKRSTVSSSFTNVATATGLSPKNVKVHSTDHAKVVVKVKTSSTSGAQFTG